MHSSAMQYIPVCAAMQVAPAGGMGCCTGSCAKQDHLMTKGGSCALQELDLAMKEGQYAQMTPLIERAKTEGLFAAEELLHIGRVCMQIPDIPHGPSAKAAFSAALQLMRSQKEPPPRMDKLAEVMHPYQSSERTL